MNKEEFLFLTWNVGPPLPKRASKNLIYIHRELGKNQYPIYSMCAGCVEKDIFYFMQNNFCSFDVESVIVS